MGAAVSFQLGFSKEFGVTTTDFLANLIKTLKIADTLTLTNKINLLNSQQASQTSAFSITGPTSTDNYTGPVELNVFQDNVYGTFMFGAIPQPTFNLSAAPSSQTVIVGGCVNYSVSVSALVSGFNSQVNLKLTAGLPPNASYNFTPSSITGAGSSTLHVCTSSSTPSTPAGTYQLTLKGTSGIEAHTTTVTLIVNQPTPPGNFNISATPSFQTITAGDSASFAVSVTALNGFTGNVALDVTGLPGDAFASFGPASISGSGTSFLNISSSTSTGTYFLTITGTSGTLTHSVGVTLTINPSGGGCGTGRLGGDFCPLQ